MTNKRNDGGDKARVKFRYIEFDVEGGTPAIQDGLRHIAAALTRAAPAAPAPRALPSASDHGGRIAPEAPVNGELPFPTQEQNDADEAIDVTAASASSDAKPRQPRRPPEFTVVNGLNLEAGDGYPSLENFAKEKGADSHHARYLVTAVWFNRHAGIKEFTANHAFTVYKRLGWGSTPPDAGQPLRELKKRKLIESGEKAGTFIVNDAGFDRVKAMGGT